MKKVLVTGGAGFIGATLLRRLRLDWCTIVFDNLSRGRREDLPEDVELVEGDIRDQGAINSACNGIDALIHLAAYGSVVESVSDPMTNFDINAKGTLHVLEAARAANVERVILASTGGALIGNAIPPVNEKSLPRPISPYGASKLCGEAYGHAFAKAYGLRTIALRFANVYGPFSAHKKGAVTVFMKAIMRGSTISIYGDGSATRDYLHVEDLCTGIIQALSADIPGGEVFHLASGVETSVAKLAEYIREAAGAPSHPIEVLPKRPGEVERNFATYDKAAAAFGFQPGRDLRDGIRQTWQWYLQNRGLVLNSDEQVG